MSTVVNTLLDFLLDLFRDPQKAAAYEADPRAALDAAGLQDATPEDVADLAPMVSDYATVTGWSGGGRADRDDDRGGSDGDDEGGRGRHCDDDRGGSARPVDDDHGGHSGGGVAPVDRDEDEPEEEGNASGGGHHHHAPAPAGGTETVVITHLQEVHYTHNETTVEIDASHSIWVSGDAQAIFGDVEGDVTQIDNEGGIVAGDDVEDSTVDNSDSSVSDSYNTDVDVDVDIDDSNVNVGGDQAVDSFDTEVEVKDNTLVVGDDNTVVSGDGNAVGNTVVTDNSETDNSVDVEFDDAIVQTGDGTVVNDSEDVGVGNTETTVEDNNLVFAGDDAIVDSEVADSQNEDNDGIDDSIVGSGNGSDFSDDDVTVEDNEVAIGGENANTGYQEESGNEDSLNEVEFEFDYEESTAIEANSGAEVDAS